MHVLFLSQFFSTTKGGGEYVFSTLTKKLAENEHKIWVITNKIEGENYDSQKNMNIIFVPPNLQYKGGLPPSFSDNFAYVTNSFIKGYKIIKKEKIDLIHSNNFSPALAGSLLSSFTRVPHITTVHDVVSLCGSNFWKNWAHQSGVSKINSFLGPIFEKFMFKLKIDYIHAVSESTKEDLLKFGAKKPIRVINNAIEISEYNTIEENKFQFVCINRLVFYKNLEVVFRAIKKVKQKEPKIKLIIIGDGPQRIVLEKLSKKMNLEQNIEFKGFVTTKEKEGILSKSNALLFPSICEGFGLVILEAFSQKKPVLVSDIRPMSDIVSHKKTGFVLNPNNEDDWAEAILELANNFEISSEMGIMGRKELEEKYNTSDMYKKIIQLYQECVSK